MLLNLKTYISGAYVFGMQVADLWSRAWQPVRRWVDCAQNRGYYYRQCEFLTVFLGDVMKALIFMLVSGFILCLPHAQAIAANSVCQKVCAGGDQKCLDCCAENYEPVKQMHGATKSCIDVCSSRETVVGTATNLPACVEECREDKRNYILDSLRRVCNPDANNEDEYKADKDRLYRECLRRCSAGPVLEMGDPEKCRQGCRRILTD